ncbi:MAG TPA: FRG domain-containing protein [Terriglobia bacterium]|nr:FRG domain-containing protein [Terriglobia bacterium]
MKSNPYDVIRLNSWEDFLSLAAESPYHNWAFRGQRDATRPLFSAVSRYLLTYRIDPQSWPEQEERILRIFKRKAIHFLDHVPDPEDDFQWLALMQDHGAPTRLLDFTWSPYVAAFFALHNATKDAIVWACNPFEIERMKKLDVSKPGAFRKHFLSDSKPFVWMGEPHAMNRRLIAQSGTFLVPSVLDQPIEDILAGYPNPKGTLIKFVLPVARIREKGMRELYKMNITQASLFPDLDGLARSLAYELEFHWAYDPRKKRNKTP